MSYVNLDAVLAKLPPTVSEAAEAGYAAQRLIEIDNEINGRLSARFSMPADATASPHFYGLLQRIEADIVVADVDDHAREAESDDSPAMWWARELRAQARALLDGLVAGTEDVDDAILADGGLADDGLTAEVIEEDRLEPFFRRRDVW